MGNRKGAGTKPTIKHVKVAYALPLVEGVGVYGRLLIPVLQVHSKPSLHDNEDSRVAGVASAEEDLSRLQNHLWQRGEGVSWGPEAGRRLFPPRGPAAVEVHRLRTASMNGGRGDARARRGGEEEGRELPVVKEENHRGGPEGFGKAIGSIEGEEGGEVRANSSAGPHTLLVTL